MNSIICIKWEVIGKQLYILNGINIIKTKPKGFVFVFFDKFIL